jgi:hypothetical protein
MKNEEGGMKKSFRALRADFVSSFLILHSAFTL